MCVIVCLYFFVKGPCCDLSPAFLSDSSFSLPWEECSLSEMEPLLDISKGHQASPATVASWLSDEQAQVRPEENLMQRVEMLMQPDAAKFCLGEKCKFSKGRLTSFGASGPAPTQPALFLANGAPPLSLPRHRTCLTHTCSELSLRILLWNTSDVQNTNNNLHDEMTFF